MKARLTDLRNEKMVKEDFKISLTSENRKDDKDLRALITSLEEGKTKIALAWLTDGCNGVNYFECK